MLRNLAWQASDDLTRAQLVMFHELSEAIGLTPDDRRRALNLDDQTWQAWNAFLADGALPAAPPVPEILQRIGQSSFHLSVILEGRQQRNRGRQSLHGAAIANNA